MSLKAELETWAAALKAYDAEDFDKSLELFFEIADSSKILTNIGLIYATVGEHNAAVEHFKKAVTLDQYLAIAYFQCGVSNFLLENYDESHKNFEEALLYLRGNKFINYEQLGLKFRLFSAEVLFNKGLSLVYMKRLAEGLVDMEEARREKITDDHNVIDDAIQERAEGYTVFSIPVGVIYRPSEKKLKNSVTRDYMGKAKLVASSDPNDEETSFSGAARLKLGISPTGLFLPDPLDTNFSTNLIRSATVPPVTSPHRHLFDKPKSAGVERSKTSYIPGTKLIEHSDMPKSAGVERSKTSYIPGMNLTGRFSLSKSAGVERSKMSYIPGTNTQDSGPEKFISPMDAGVRRNNTQIIPARASPNATIGGQGQVRSLNIRKLGATALPQVSPQDGILELYDEYLDSYNRRNSPPSDRIGTWRLNLSRSNSRNVPSAQSSYSGRSMRNNSKRGNPHAFIRARSNEEEEEGYGSGEYDDGLIELSLIRVKLHYQDDIRGMTLTPDTPFADFMDKILAKFYKEANGLYLRFKDEDGGRVSLRDESDYELAIETARESARGKAEGKLEIWCIDT